MHRNTHRDTTTQSFRSLTNNNNNNNWCKLKIFLCSVGLSDGRFLFNRIFAFLNYHFVNVVWNVGIHRFDGIFSGAPWMAYIAILKCLCTQCIGYVHDFYFHANSIFHWNSELKKRTRSLSCSQTAKKRVQFNLRLALSISYSNYNKVCLLECMLAPCHCNTA